MSFITWKDSFSVGVHSIDDQHKKLVEMINNLYVEFYKGITNEFLNKLIAELEKYTVYHFSFEEKFMKIYDYDDFATFLKNWLLKHIMGTDKKYSALFQEKKMD